MRRRITLPLAGLLVVLAGPAAGADPQGVWTLADCQAEALYQSRPLQAADARVRAARAMVRQAGQWSHPDVTFSALTDERQAVLLQEVDVWGKRAAAVRAADAQAQVVSAGRALVQRELLEEVARSYWHLAASRRLVALREEERTVRRRFMAIREQEVSLGALAHADMIMLRETEAEGEQSLRQARLDADSARAVLNTLLGRRPDAPLEIAGVFPGEVHYGAEEVLAAALQTDPGVQEARARILAAGYRIEQEQREWRPNPRGGPAVKEQEGNWTAGFQLSVSIPVWNHNRAAIGAAEAGKQQARAEMEAAERLALQTAYLTLLEGVALSEALADYEETMLPSAAERHHVAVQGFQAGDLSEREMLGVRLEWLNRQQEVEELRYRRAAASSRVELILRPWEGYTGGETQRQGPEGTDGH